MAVNQHRQAAPSIQRVPLVREVLADLDTPLSAYLKVAAGPYSYLLESVQGHEQWGRYSIIGLPARVLLKVYGSKVSVQAGDSVIDQTVTADPLDYIQAFIDRYQVELDPNLPRFTGGLVGYFGYDTIGYVEPRLRREDKEDLLGNPDILLLLSEELLVFDNLTGKISIIVHADPSEPGAIARGERRLDELVAALDRPLPDLNQHPQRKMNEEEFVSGFTQAGFEAAVERVKQYILDGDVMQTVLSQRLSAPFGAAPINLYRALRSTNPSPYMYFFDMGDFHIVGSSPEILVRLENRELTVRPIAGTRPRGRDHEEDLALERELLADPKELAEHVMLIDLGRNDVGRVAVAGSVHLSERMIIERYSHVMHIVSNVIGQLRPGLTAVDVLRAAFPAGTVSGAPKIRAMEIIDELEPIKRGIYSGAVGYLAWTGNMDTAIAIRTAVISGGQLHIQVGAGIVADSVPEKEWQETMNKGRAIFRAAALAESGLRTP
jgi:anthranilate synthase component 1